MPDRLAPWRACLGALLIAGCAPDNAAVPLDSPQAGALLRVGDDLRARGELAGAIAFYQRAVAADPGDAGARTRLADAFAAAGDAGQARANYAAAQSLDPSLPGAVLGLVRAELALGAPERALALLDAATAPRDGRALAARAAAYDMLGRSDEAQAIYRAGLAADPGNLDLLANLALSQAMAGDLAAARDTIRPLGLRPDASVRQRTGLVLVLALAGDEPAARAAAIPLGPDVDAPLIAQARALLSVPPGAARARALGLAG